MKFLVRPELPTASVGSWQATTAAVDNSAPLATRPESIYKSGKAVQTNGATSGVAMQIHLADYPQLKLLAWNRRDDDLVEEEEAFALYERNWHFVEEEKLSLNERQLIERLTTLFGKGVMNV